MSAFRITAASWARTLTGLGFVLIAQGALAAEVRILNVRAINDSSIPARTLVLGTNAEGDLTGLKIYTAGQGVTSDYDADQFREGSLVLFQSDPDLLAPNGRDIIRLDARLVTPEKGGAVRMDYAVNALTGNFDSVRLELDRDGTGQWSLKQNGRSVSTLLMEKGSLGIREIEFR